MFNVNNAATPLSRRHILIFTLNQNTKENPCPATYAITKPHNLQISKDIKMQNISLQKKLKAMDQKRQIHLWESFESMCMGTSVIHLMTREL